MDDPGGRTRQVPASSETVRKPAATGRELAVGFDSFGGPGSERIDQEEDIAAGAVARPIGLLDRYIGFAHPAGMVLGPQGAGANLTPHVSKVQIQPIRNSLGRTAVVGFVLLNLVLADVPAHADARFERIAREIRSLVAGNTVPSIAVAVAKDGRIIWEFADGWADRERGIPATSHTPYSLASISKPFTATAVLKLVEAGRLALDSPVKQLLGTGSHHRDTSGTRHASARTRAYRRSIRIFPDAIG